MNQKDKKEIKLALSIHMLGGAIMTVAGICIAKLLSTGINNGEDPDGTIMLIMMICGALVTASIGIKRILGSIKILKQLNDVNCTQDDIDRIDAEMIQSEEKKANMFKIVFSVGMLIVFIIFIINSYIVMPENILTILLMSSPFIIVSIAILYTTLKK